MLLQAPQLRQELQAKGKDIDMGELIKRWIMTSGISGTDKIITDYVPTQPAPGMDPMGMGGQVDPATGQPMPPQAGMEGQQPPAGGMEIQDPEIRAVADQLFGGGGLPNGGF